MSEQPSTPTDPANDAAEVRITDRDGVRQIEINRPRSKNALTQDTNRLLIDAVRSAGASSDIRVIVLTGAGGHFSSGLDLKEAMRRGPRSPEQLGQDLDDYFHALIRAVASSPCPTVASIDGAAVGFGGDLALACDIRLMSDRARFGEIFVRRGLIPDGGSSFHLPRLIGAGRALELMLTGDIIDARTALEVGLCNHVYPVAELADETWKLAARLAKGAPMAQQLIKRNVRESLSGTLDDALARERDGQLRCLHSRDFAEGVTAFFSKREPRFKGE